MKTNKIFIVALGLAVTAGLASCSDNMLNTASKTQTTTANYYRNTTDAYYALNGVYDGWQGTVSKGPTFSFYTASEMMADECLGGTGYTDARNSQVVDRFSTKQDVSQNDLYESLWTYYYNAIYRANELIIRTDQIDWEGNTALQGQYIGEARAIRGILYFDLTRMFGNVPLITTPTKDLVPATPADSIYAQIIADLTYAAENIPAKAYPKSSAAQNDGRITPYAAKAMLARIYLFYTGYYGKEPVGLTKAQALQYCEDVINSGEYQLVKSFKNLWPAASTAWTEDANGTWTKESTYAGAGNSETILSMKFNYDSDWNGNNNGNRSIVFIGVRGGIFKAPYGQGWGACTVNTKLVQAYPSGDKRREASIIDIANEGIETMKAYQDQGIKDQREYTGYFIKKYSPQSKYVKQSDGSWKLTHDIDGLNANGDFQTNQYQDYVLMRYADVLLMAAELGSPNAQKYFNEVHQRAYQESDGTLSSDYVEMSATPENIQKERRLEFAFEGIRYWDLLRQGVTTAANTIAESSTQVLSGGNKETYEVSAQDIINKKGLCQIPLTEIQLSNYKLQQNPGW